jgi:hypothetical protein
VLICGPSKTELPSWNGSGPCRAISPSHGTAGDLTLIAQTRSYLHDFVDAIKSGDAKAAERWILAKYPEYHVRHTSGAHVRFVPNVELAIHVGQFLSFLCKQLRSATRMLQDDERMNLTSAFEGEWAILTSFLYARVR